MTNLHTHLDFELHRRVEGDQNIGTEVLPVHVCDRAGEDGDCEFRVVPVPGQGVRE